AGFRDDVSGDRSDGRAHRRGGVRREARARGCAALRAGLHVRARPLGRHVFRGRPATMKRLTIAAVALLALALPSQALATDFHPEDEFQLHPWVPIHLGPLDLSINKAVAYLMLGTVLSILIGIVLMRVRLGVKPSVRQTIGEQIYEVAQVQIAEQGLPSKAIGRWFPYVATLFIFIWVINMVGFIPLPLSDEKFH